MKPTEEEKTPSSGLCRRGTSVFNVLSLAALIFAGLAGLILAVFLRNTFWPSGPAAGAGFLSQLILVLGGAAISLGCAGVPLFCHAGRWRWLAYLAVGLVLGELVVVAVVLLWKVAGGIG